MSQVIPKINQIFNKLNFALRHLFLNIKNGILHLKVGSFWWRSKTSEFQSYIKRLSFISRAGFTSSVALFIISLFIVFPIYYKTQLAEAADGPSNTVLSISSNNLAVAMDLLVTSGSGTFVASNPLSFTVATTNSSGYTLSLKSKNGSTDLTNTSVDGTGTSVSGTFTSITNASGISADIFSDSSNTAYNNHWGIKPSHYESIANNDGLYYPSPDSDGVILNATDKANASGTVDIYTIAIGARATYAQPAGTYTNTYILSAIGNIALTHTLSIANGSNISSSTGAGEYDEGEEVELTATSTSNTTCLTYGTPAWTAKASDGSAATGYFKSTSSTTATGASVTYVMGSTDDVIAVSSTQTRNTYTITYNNNGGTGTMSDTVASCGIATTLRANTFTKNGYNFLGWATSSSATSTTYTNGQSITLSQTNTLTLYAVWKSCTNTTFSGTMQSITATTIANACNGNDGTLTDSRDSNTYTVKKINGQLWMTQNLRITGTIPSTGSNFTRVNSFNVSQYLITNSSNCGGTGSASKGYLNACYRDSKSATTGVWYNFVAATAGEIVTSTSYTPATQDICPTGWHLPDAPNTSANTDLSKLMGSTETGWQSATDGLNMFNAVKGGYYRGGYSKVSDSSYGYWWSSVGPNNNAWTRYLLGYNSENEMYIGMTTGWRDSGYFIRCVHTD